MSLLLLPLRSTVTDNHRLKCTTHGWITEQAYGAQTQEAKGSGLQPLYEVTANIFAIEESIKPNTERQQATTLKMAAKICKTRTKIWKTMTERKKHYRHKVTKC